MEHYGLIFDIGANDGADSNFYLRKGFRVVAIEANPLVARKLKGRLCADIMGGGLSLLNVGIWSQRGSMRFYSNLDNDHWSSFDTWHGTRYGSRYETLDIECILFNDLIERFGVPYYAKVDVEGADKIVITSITRETAPQYVSYEDFGVAGLDHLSSIGYTEFFLAPQMDKGWARAPNPPLEGRYVDRHSSGRDSGLFGREIPGPWLDYATARQVLTTTVRSEAGEWLVKGGEWYDVHARRPDH